MKDRAFSLGNNRRKEHKTQFCMPLSPVFTKDCGGRLNFIDEPTSGLDPVSREELLEIFLRLAEEGVAILFSTHITSDLEKCADDITYIQKGEILATGPIGEFQQSYRLIRRQGGLTAEQQAAVLGRCREKAGDTLLIRRERTPLFEGLPVEEPTLEEIMVHLEKEGEA